MGFYSKSELQKTSKIKIDINQLKSVCGECQLYKGAHSPKMKIDGMGKKKILIIGEAPSKEDDQYGTPFAEEEGQILSDELHKNGISFRRDCWRIYAVRCCPTKKIDQKQINFCKPYLEKMIHKMKPELILVSGDIAINALFGSSFSDRSTSRWRGYCIPDEKFKCNIIPITPVRAIVNKFSDKNLRKVFERDIKSAVFRLDRTFLKRKDYESFVTTVTDFKQLEKLLKRVIKKRLKISLDYETTGLKPFKKGHKIASIGFALSSMEAYAFPYQYRDYWTKAEEKKIRRYWNKILSNEEIEKVAHNSKFEGIWSYKFFEVQPKWHFDTMMAEHILDNRARANGLKFQTFVKFGVRPYDEHIATYLKSKGDSEFNTVEKAPLKDLLLYNGLDCIFTFKLYQQQKRKLSKMGGLQDAYNFFMDGLDVMGTIQTNGITTNEKYYIGAKKRLKKKIDKLNLKLETGREAKKFRKKYGRPLKISSNKDLGLLFYEVLGKKPIYTAKGSYKTDKVTLELLNLPFVDTLMEMKKYEKARGTYLGQFSREIEDGKMHPFFDLHIPVSYRSSSSRPNFQNLPNRDLIIRNLIRKGIVPDLLCVLSEIDFSGAEVITSATYHKDPTFIKYLVDKNTDMHRDNAIDLLMLKPNMLNSKKFTPAQKKLAKMIRFFAKNNWTFAQFYGDWFASCAPSFWENVVDAGLELPNGMTAMEWLNDKGIYELGEMEKNGPTPGSFLEHAAKVEDKMWNKRFPVYTQWKKDIVDFYQKYGFIENHFGFRFTGYMGKNQCTNFPIQSASFHLLVYTLIETQKMIKRLGLKTKIIGQIHDSIVSNVPKDEVGIYHREVNKIVKSLQDRFNWLIVPMEIEAEISALREEGGNFSEMREIDPDNAVIWHKEAA